MYGVVKSEQKKIQRLTDNGVYLLTGGAGGIALSCCEAIVKTVSKPTFILLSRSQFPLESNWHTILQNHSHQYYEKIRVIRKLQKLGATFLFYQVDISEFSRLNKIIRECISCYGKINGLIHTAGVSNAELVQFKSKKTAQTVFMPKIHGTYNLIRALKDTSLDFVILTSSLAALLGGFQQIDYSGSNASLDAFANSHLFSFSSFVASINWNTWQEVGMAAEAALRGESTFLGKGNDISPQQGQKLFLEILQGNETQVAISNSEIDFDSAIEESISTGSIPMVKIARKELHVVTNYQAPSNEVETKLVQLWQDMLGVDEIGVTDDFFALGGHSFNALSLIEKINNSFNCTLPATQIYHNPTIRQLYSTITNGLEKKQSKNPILLKKGEKKSPYLFLCHPISGLIHCFNSFVSQSELPITIYGFQDPSIEATRMVYGSLQAMADDYLSAIKKIQPIGPYFLMGYSFGGHILYEIANNLIQQGETIGLLVMIDSWAINPQVLQNEHHFKKHMYHFDKTLPKQLINLAWQREQLLLNHSLSESNQEIVLFKASNLDDEFRLHDNPTNGWANYNRGKMICHSIKGNHNTILNDSNSKYILHLMHQYLNQKLG